MKRLLETNGYDCRRSAGSRSPVDVVAFKPGQVVMVQAKLNGRCPPAERAELVRVAGLVGAVPLLAYRITRQGTRFRRLFGTGAREWAEWAPDALRPH
ncbi:hypothetical protein QX204_24390 [Nocardia sp. PE-7]|uniref:hypothetical protein n=1 Tax=Nocardia sp. PE-7 TaxID=3058426 RepID=UPI002658C78F|nr:hypothetical protein [Nocardia sp. PE-7]WKG08183.1 hypothetical protein QX204_24390 [Nocardia sp. PE-7]